MSDTVNVMTAAAAAKPAVEMADWPAASLALVATGGLVAALVTNAIGYAPFMVAHVLLVAALAARHVQRMRAGGDGTATLLLTFAVATLGPLGALGGLLVGWLAQRGREDEKRLEDWYDRISLSVATDAVTRLSDRIVEGRVARNDSDSSAPFARLLRSGSIAEKQTILGLIARKFHPEHLPALQLALVADEPVIRVQAAAVAAKIRGELPALTTAALRAAADPLASPEAAIGFVETAEQCVASGLLEDAERSQANAVIDGVVAGLTDRLSRAPAPVLDRAADSVIARYEAHLIASRRYGALRGLRRARAWRRRGPWRYRALPRRSSRASGPAKQRAAGPA